MDTRHLAHGRKQKFLSLLTITTQLSSQFFFSHAMSNLNLRIFTVHYFVDSRQVCMAISPRLNNAIACEKPPLAPQCAGHHCHSWAASDQRVLMVTGTATTGRKIGRWLWARLTAGSVNSDGVDDNEESYRKIDGDCTRPTSEKLNWRVAERPVEGVEVDRRPVENREWPIAQELPLIEGKKEVDSSEWESTEIRSVRGSSSYLICTYIGTQKNN